MGPVSRAQEPGLPHLRGQAREGIREHSDQEASSASAEDSTLNQVSPGLPNLSTGESGSGWLIFWGGVGASEGPLVQFTFLPSAVCLDGPHWQANTSNHKPRPFPAPSTQSQVLWCWAGAGSLPPSCQLLSASAPCLPQCCPQVLLRFPVQTASP